jgi:hypothetical protein
MLVQIAFIMAVTSIDRACSTNIGAMFRPRAAQAEITVPILISKPDPLQQHVQQLRRRGFKGLIHVTSDIEANGRVSQCRADADLSLVDKKLLCSAAMKRIYKTDRRARLVDSFTPPSVR